jgi:hypothetical protein
VRPSGIRSVERDWVGVSASAPCVICGATEGCRRGFEGEFVCCFRISSVWPLTNGGWVHRAANVTVEEPIAGSSHWARTAALAP